MLKIHKYSDSFAEKFKKEKEKLIKIIGNDCLVEHIGSTAIPGVDGKGVIDIMLVFDKNNEIEVAIELLLKNGYFLPNDQKNREGRVFMSSAGQNKESGLNDIHLHLTTKDNESYKNAIMFRDFLRKNKKEREQYIKLKYKLFKKTDGDRKKYTQLKSDFIKKIISKKKLKFAFISFPNYRFGIEFIDYFSF